MTKTSYRYLNNIRNLAVFVKFEYALKISTVDFQKKCEKEKNKTIKKSVLFNKFFTNHEEKNQINILIAQKLNANI